MNTKTIFRTTAFAIVMGASLAAHAGGLLGGSLGGNLGGSLNGSLNGMGGLNRPIVTDGAGRSALGAMRDSAGSQVDASRTFGRATAANARATGSAVKDVAGSVQGPDVAGTAKSVNLGGSISGSGNAASEAKAEKKTD